MTLPESGRPGLILFLPIYRQGAPVATVAQRRDATKALVASSFEAHQLGLRRPGAAARGDRDPDPGRRQARSSAPRASLDDAVDRPVDAAGRSWVVRVQTPVHTSAALPLTILLGGLVLSALVGALLLAPGRARQERTEGDRHAAEERFRRAFEDSGRGHGAGGRGRRPDAGRQRRALRA